MAKTDVYIFDVETKKAVKALQVAEKSVRQLENTVVDGERAVLKWQNAMAKSTNVTQEDVNELKRLQGALKGVKNELKGAKLEQKDANYELGELKKNSTELTGSMKMLDKATGGMVTSAKQSKTAFTGMIRGANGVKLALAATGIGLFVLALVSITQAFKRSEEGQEKWERGMAMIGAVTNQILDGLALLGEWLIGFPKMVKDAFSSPKETLKSFGTMIKTMVMDKVDAVLEGMGLIGSAIKKAFSGDFSGALKDAGEGFSTLNNELNPMKIAVDAVAEGTKNLAGAIKEVVDETMNEVDAMIQITKMRQEAHHLERALIVERAEANRDISAIRLEAEKRDIYTASQRIAMLKEAQQIEEDITDKEIKAKKLKVDALKKEMELGLNNKQIKDDLAKLEAELINLDTKRTRSQRLLQTQITTATNQELAENQKLIDDKKAKELAFEEWKDEFALTMLSTEEEKHQRKLLQIDQEFADKQEQARVHFENKLMTEEEFAIIEAQLIKERDDTKLSYEASVDEKAFNRKKKENLRLLSIEEKLERDKTRRRRKSLNAIIQLAGAESKIGRMALIAKNVLAAKEMIMEAKKTIAFSKSAVAKSVVAVNEGAAKTAKIGFPQNVPALLMYAVQAVGIISAIKKAVRGAKESTVGTGVGGSIPEPQTPSVPSVASISQQEDVQAFTPSFNTLGATQGNQIADVLGTAPPVQAYVVSQDVTTAQSLDNNIISSASLG